ncbi:MAG: AAA family ATPase [Phascolarctobacterium sp.]|nr:AAA family ATPase [Phascolarctobacterium sp.]
MSENLKVIDHAWFVGASVGKSNFRENCINEGKWVSFKDDETNKEKVRSIKKGDRIVLKTSYTKQNNLPFDNKGEYASVMCIKAIGVVTENLGDGKNIKVAWTKIENKKEWFGSPCYRGTIHSVRANDQGNRGLFDFIFLDKAQVFAKQEAQVAYKKQIELKSTAKNRLAQEIIDVLYDYDRLLRLYPVLQLNDNNITIDKTKAKDIITSSGTINWLFVLPNAGVYDTKTFKEKEYHIKMNGKSITFRLSTEWEVPKEVKARGNSSFLTLIALVNEFYKGIIEIKEVNEKWYLYFFGKEKFESADLPEDFQEDESRRFITSLLAKPFVILTGNSGTGKTRIAKQFAKYLQVDVDGKPNYLLVPVGADWTDNTKILGYFNPLANNGSGAYVKTEILELIERANANKHLPYFLILDEMNLSHVERYFADFLSHMEVPDEKFIIDKLRDIEYPKNLFVVGTVNIDETTYMFSPKVLDRANVIEFKPAKDSVLGLFENQSATDEIVPANDGSAEAFLNLAYAVCEGKDDLVDFAKIKDQFTVIYDELDGSGFEFAYRTVSEIKKYILAAKKLQDVNAPEETYIDEQLVQKILPKIHGNQKEIGKLLENLKVICGKANPSDNEEKYPLSYKKIEEMERRLANVRYASFI